MTFVPLTTEERTWMERDAVASMSDTCDIMRVAPGAENPDGTHEPGTTTTTTVPCRFDDTGGASEFLLALGIVQGMNALMLVPRGTDVTNTDTISFKGDVYIIIDINDVQTYGTSTELTVKLQGTHP